MLACEERTSEAWALLILGSNSSDKAEILLLFIILRSSLFPYGLRRPSRPAPSFNLVKFSSDGVWTQNITSASPQIFWSKSLNILPPDSSYEKSLNPDNFPAELSI